MQGRGPELFFPVGTTGPALGDVAAAKRACRRRPVIAQCLAWALSSGQTAGVWGGTGEEETEPLPERAGTPTGRRVLAILQKRHTDLTDGGLRVTRDIVETVTAEQDTENEPEAGEDRRRHRPMTLGHDPLKPRW
ncbi:WhiB family transcriptional regulator [Streptomyces caeni]|uniref:WhiB family transcriptional regulator n=1 Tax=Streptomyces caeni TaxID=2307231 RepID=A0ABW4IP36_9ACTN